MSAGSSDLVRSIASERYVKPAIEGGKVRFSIAVKDVLQDLVAEGFPPGNTPQVCSALRKRAFLRSHGIEIEAIDGPPSKTSTTVVYRYRVANAEAQSVSKEEMTRVVPQNPAAETPEQWAHRMTGKLCGLMKDEIAAMGGGEAFLRWVRGYDEEDAP